MSSLLPFPDLHLNIGHLFRLNSRRPRQLPHSMWSAPYPSDCAMVDHISLPNMPEVGGLPLVALVSREVSFVNDCQSTRQRTHAVIHRNPPSRLSRPLLAMS